MTRHVGRHSRPSLVASVAGAAVRAVQFIRAIRVTFRPAAKTEDRGDDFTLANLHATPLAPIPMAADLVPFAPSPRVHPYKETSA